MWESFFSDDGSRDGTWRAVVGLRETDDRVAGECLSRNFGHQYALLAGLTAASGRAVITIDADHQHPPSLIPELPAAWERGVQIMNTIRRDTGPHLREEFYDVLARNMRILGTPVRSRRFYGLMLYQYASDAMLYVARVEGRPIAASLGVSINDRLENLSSASLPQFRNLKATSLLYWTIIEAACSRGLKMLDLGRSKYDSGTYDFKAQLGCKPLGLEYVYYLNRASDVPDVSPENPSYRLAITTWQRLPLAVTKWIGPRLIRYIA